MCIRATSDTSLNPALCRCLHFEPEQQDNATWGYNTCVPYIISIHLIDTVVGEMHAEIVQLHVYPEEDGTRHVINDFIWEMSIRTISTKVEDVSHKNL